MPERERWATRIGLVLAMAGNAVGLGTFIFYGQSQYYVGTIFARGFYISGKIFFNRERDSG